MGPHGIFTPHKGPSMRTIFALLTLSLLIGCDTSSGVVVDENGQITPAGERGPKGDPGPQGERGPQGPPGAGFPQWVLRDRNGDRVDGVFGPVSLPAKKSSDYDRLPFGVFAEARTPCFTANELEGQRWPPIAYNLVTGQPLEGCVEMIDQIDERSGNYFLTNDCSGNPVQRLQLYVNDREGTWQFLKFKGNPIVFEGKPDIILGPNELMYVFDGNFGCVEYPKANAEIPIWIAKPMPTKYVNAFPDGPYTIELETP